MLTASRRAVAAQVVGGRHRPPPGRRHLEQLERPVRASRRAGARRCADSSAGRRRASGVARAALDPQPLAVLSSRYAPIAGVSARTTRSSSAAGPRRVEPPLGRVDLVGVGDALLRLLRQLQRAGLGPVERLDQQLAAERREPRRQRAGACRPGRIGSAPRERHRARVEALRRCWKIVTPVSRVARHQRALDRRRAAPARQQRRVHVQHQVARQQRLLDQLPELADADRLRLGCVDRRHAPRRRSRSASGAARCRARGRPRRPAAARACGRGPAGGRAA